MNPTIAFGESQMNPANLPTVQRTIRFPGAIDGELEQLARGRGTPVAVIVKDAVRQYLDRDRQSNLLEGVEERLVATMTRVLRELRVMRNDQHLTMAFVDTLAQTFLLHTPPLPPDAVEAAAASATVRHGKYTRAVVGQLQGSEGLWHELTDAVGNTAGDNET